MGSDRKENYDRRHFLRDIGYGGLGGLIIFASFGFRIFKGENGKIIKAIAVDFTKCSGCRTCETACSAFNHKVLIDGEEMNGLGNPHLSNITVHHFNPDVDVPSTCALCPDAPCIEACPIEPDLLSGRKALYHDEKLQTIHNDLERCIGCMQCANACAEYRGGVIHPNTETNKPERMCRLCDGDPQCVKNCPYGALQFLAIDDNRDLENLAPESIAKRLIEKFYSIKSKEAAL